MDQEQKKRFIEAAGYTIKDYAVELAGSFTAPAYYALLPGIRKLVSNSDGNNYIGFFPSMDALLNEVSAIVAADTMGFHDLSDGMWDSLSVMQKIELAKETDGGFDFGDWRRGIKPGDDVFWNDPDDDASSGIYTVVAIHTPTGSVTSEDDILFVKNESGSEAEVYVCELSKVASESLRLRLVLDVEYEQNGVSLEWLKNNLAEMCQRGIGEGMLTGSSSAEVKSHTIAVEDVV